MYIFLLYFYAQAFLWMCECNEKAIEKILSWKGKKCNKNGMNWKYCRGRSFTLSRFSYNLACLCTSSSRLSKQQHSPLRRHKKICTDIAQVYRSTGHRCHEKCANVFNYDSFDFVLFMFSFLYNCSSTDIAETLDFAAVFFIIYFSFWI